jgi:hypothetical protein
MKIMISFLSLVIILAGVIHFFDKFFLPTKGAGYSIVLLVLGIILLGSSFVNQLLLGLEKFFLVIQAILLIGIAILPFFTTFLTFLPREGFLYAGMVILVGAIGFIYGILGMG